MVRRASLAHHAEQAKRVEALALKAPTLLSQIVNIDLLFIHIKPSNSSNILKRKVD